MMRWQALNNTSSSKKKRKRRSKSVGNSSAFCLAAFSESAARDPYPKHHKKRIRSTYEDNYSAALALPCSSATLKAAQNNPLALLALSQTHIKEHAARRVDLFFYTLVAYYKTGLSPKQGHTELQHGIGRNARDHSSITQACHSSLLPSLVDESRHASAAEMEENPSILNGTHFLDSLNATVELPVIVNEFDNELENTFACREQSILILQQVSAGEINPIEGLNQFMKMLDTTLKNIATKIQRTGTLFAKIHTSENELLQLVKQGTFAKIFSADKQAATDEYIESLLRFTPAEKALCNSNENQRKKIYYKKITDLQTEILQTERQYFQLPRSP